jgi:drug/metabolite transporter (DMT)-like permease
MIWIFLSICSSILIFVVFTYLKKYSVDNLQAILVNYLVAFSIGQLQMGFSKSLFDIPQQPWINSVLILGFLFITLFNLMAWVSQNFGLTTVSIAVKMSVMVPISFGIWYYNESASVLKISAVILALLAVWMSTYKPQRIKSNPLSIILPIILFLGSGFLDSFLKYNQEELVPAADQAWFASSIFGFAGVFGLVAIIYRYFTMHVAFHWKAVVGGIALGIPNYGSIYFLLRALDSPGMESSTLFAINNVGIVALSSLLGYFAFKEKLSKINIAGIALAIIAIVLITFVI